MSTSYNTAARRKVSPDSDFAWYLDAVRGFDYVAAMSRRCPNWIEVNLQSQPEHCPVFADLLTENGLLMQAEEIAGRYRQTGRFPRIALLDDVLVHGRSLNRFLQTFLELLAACLRTDDLDALLDELCKSLTLFVLVANDAPVLLRQEYQWRMQFKDIAVQNEWRWISNHISQTICQAEVANTSYVVSARCAQSAPLPAPGGWELVAEDEISYRDACQRLYVHVLSGTRKAYPTVRSYLRGSFRYYTPYFFCDTLTDTQLGRLFSLVASQLEGDALAQFQPFLRLVNHAAAHQERWMVYFQLVNLLLGQITLHSFLADAGLSPTQFHLDTEKIACNFGLPQEVKPSLDALCAIFWTEDFLVQVCDALEIPDQVLQISYRVVSAEQILTTMSLAVQLQAARHEAYAKNLERAFAAGRGTTDIKLTGETNFEPFLSLLFSVLPAPAWEHHTALLMLSCLTQMMDKGDVCLKARVRQDKDSGQYLFDSAVRNTEMSLSILPRRLGPYFPAFVRAAQLYQRDDNFPELASSYLKRLLPRSLPNAEEILYTARMLARIVVDYRGMSNTLLDWEGVLPETETSAY